MVKKHICILGVSWKDKVTNEEVRARTGQQSILNTLSGRRLRWLGHTIRMDHRRITHQALHWEVPGFKRGPGRPRTNWRGSQERFARNGNYLGRGGGGSSQQTRMASECGPIRSRGRGMNKSSQVL